MSFSPPVPEAIVSEPSVSNSSPTQSVSQPDYEGLVKFLVQPFLESADALKVDCEVMPRPRRVIIRVAFEGEDKGRVFGRGGRNIQAIRTVLQAVAQTTGYTAHLEIYGSQSSGRSDGEEKPATPRVQPPRPTRSRPQ